MAEATVMYEVNSACNGVLFCTKLPLIVVLWMWVFRNLYIQYYNSPLEYLLHLYLVCLHRWRLHRSSTVVKSPLPAHRKSGKLCETCLWVRWAWIGVCRPSPLDCCECRFPRFPSRIAAKGWCWWRSWLEIYECKRKQFYYFIVFLNFQFPIENTTCLVLMW